MKRNWILLGMTLVMMIAILLTAMTWVDKSEIVINAEAENGTQVMLSHIHSGEDGACYHHHKDECYTVPVTCNGSVTRTQSGICGELKKWEGTDERGFDYVYVICEGCGQFWDHRGDDMDDYHYHYANICDICGTRYDDEREKCSKVVKYDAGCGMDTQVLDCEHISCGTYRIICNDVTKWLESTTLTASVTSQDAGAAVTSYQWSTGDTSQTISVTQNNTYICEITYTDQKTGVEKTADASYVVTNLDSTPPEVTLSLTPAEPTNTGTTIHIEATDDVGVTGYSFDGTTFTPDGKDYYVTENGTYTAYAKDAAGNVGSAVITVDNIDHEAPEIISVTKSTEAIYTNGTVQINVTARDVVSEGYAREIAVKYSVDGNKWSDSGEFFIDNMSEIFVRDAAGNISTAPVTICQDTAPPSVSGTQAPQQWTKDAVCLTVTATDDQSGIPEWAYKWGDGDWNPASLFNVTANGDYPVTVRDAAGNTASYTFHVTQIDKVAPAVNVCLATEDWRDGNNIISIQASDQESGLAELAYSYDGGTTWTGAAEYEISESGDYLICVRDAVGNITESRLHAEKIMPEVDTNAQWNKKEVTEEEQTTSVATSYVSSYPVTSPILLASKSDQEGSTPKIILGISVPRPCETQLGSMIKPEFHPEIAFPHLMNIIKAAVCGGMCLFGLITFVLLRRSRKAVLCQELDNGKCHVVDRIGVERLSGGKGYTVIINDKQINEQIIEHMPLWLRFGKYFAKQHESEQLVIQLRNGRNVNTKIARKVKL